ncbi:MAG: class C beta-lactamase [Planctomycetota bacterium]
MFENPRPALRFTVVTTLFLSACATVAVDSERSRIERVVGDAIRVVMAEHDVPGVAVAVTVDRRRHVFTHGVASKTSGQPVTEHTLFEIGSISKVFTATLACQAQVTGALSFADPAIRHLRELAGSAFDAVRVLDLGTYTAGGLPLQVPVEVDDDHKLVAWLATWRPEHAAGTQRVYSNPSLGLFGEIAARSLGAPFEELMQRLLSRLGLHETHLRVPPEAMSRYADGHASDGSVTRVRPGMLGAQTYGVKTTADDLLRFLEANIDSGDLDEVLQRAIAATHVGYFDVGGMTQGLGWEMYEDPADLDRLLAGNSATVIFEANAVTRPAAPRPARAGMLFNKTGSTNGFGAYVAFVPAARIGVVILANRNYPIPARVRAAHRILMALRE